MPRNPPAFPVAEVRGYDDGSIGITEGHPGMTLRDWHAGQALPAIMSRDLYRGMARVAPGSPMHPALAAQAAYQYADAMLVEREKESSK